MTDSEFQSSKPLGTRWVKNESNALGSQFYGEMRSGRYVNVSGDGVISVPSDGIATVIYYDVTTAQFVQDTPTGLTYDLTDGNYGTIVTLANAQLTQEDLDYLNSNPEAIIGWALGHASLPSSIAFDPATDKCWPVMEGDYPYLIEINDQPAPISWSWEVQSDGEELTYRTHSVVRIYTIDWGDGTVEHMISTSNPSHVYATAGIYKVTVWGESHPYWPYGFEKDRIVAYHSFGQTKTNLVNGYMTSTVTSCDIGIFDSSYTTALAGLLAGFAGTTIAGSLDGICTAQHTSIQSLFSDCMQLETFPPGLDTFDTVNVTSMRSCFAFCHNITTAPQCENWDTSSCTTMREMFRELGRYVSGTDMIPYVGNFDTSNVTDISYMFYYMGNKVINSDLGIDKWNIGSLTAATGFMYYFGITTDEYDRTLIAWANQPHQNDVEISFGLSKYTAGGEAEAARQQLIDDGWTITDGGAA